MAFVHPSAVVDPSASLASTVSVGPFCHIGPGVTILDDTELVSHCCVLGPCSIGSRNIIHPFCSLGGTPQHREYSGETTTLSIGDDNVFHEHVTVHRGTLAGDSTTRIGHHNRFMAGVHIAHDVTVHDHVTLTNLTLVAGHVEIDSWVTSAGHVAIAPFVRIGESAFLAGNAMVERDIPPFLTAAGDRASLRCVNRVGLKRRQVPAVSITRLKLAFRSWFRTSNTRASVLESLSSPIEDPWVETLRSFLVTSSHTGIAPCHRVGGQTAARTD